jgi:aminoglycoside phosphotransferase (APT) family kinase protein
VVLPGLRTEIDVLPLLAPLLPVSIPVPDHVGVPSPAFPWPFWGARMLPGVELCDAPEASRDALAVQLGSILRALHSREVLDELGSRLGENWTHRADMQRRVPILRDKLAQLDGVWRAPAVVDDLVEEALALPPPEPSAVCHGDLHFRHVLVDGDRVTGLIDWIDLCRGDPALDLQLVWSALPPSARDVFFAEYGEVDGGTLLRARVIAIFLGCALLEYGLHEGLPAIEREARAALGRALSA